MKTRLSLLFTAAVFFAGASVADTGKAPTGIQTFTVNGIELEFLGGGWRSR